MKLVIRSANHKQPDFDVTVLDRMKTVGHVKEYLSENYPDNPDKSFMRMIFQGHLLADEKNLTDVFNSDLDCYVVHLVCLPKIKTDDVAPTTSSANVESSRPAVGRPTVATTTGSQSDTTPSQQNGGSSVNGSIPAATESRPSDSNVQQPSIPFMSNWQHLSPPSSLQYPVDLPFADWYARYYSAWLVYLSALQAQAMGLPGVEIWRTQHQLHVNARPAVPAGDNGAVDPPVQQRPENRGINAANNPLFDDDEEDGRARDLLDWVYVAVRAGILLSLIYLYSSIPRIVALIALLGSVWLLRVAVGGLNNNNNNRAQRQQAQDNPPPRENPEAPVPPADGAAPAEPSNVPAPGDTGTAAQQPPPPPPPPPVPLYRVVFTAIAGFFLSLFPDAPGLQHLD